MTVEQHDVIDFVAYDRDADKAVLVMVEARHWGLRGELLPDLERKLNTYFLYVTDGRLSAEFPKLEGKPVRFELRCVEPPGEREQENLRTVCEMHLMPMSIEFRWRQIAE